MFHIRLFKLIHPETFLQMMFNLKSNKKVKYEIKKSMNKNYQKYYFMK